MSCLNHGPGRLALTLLATAIGATLSGCGGGTVAAIVGSSDSSSGGSFSGQGPGAFLTDFQVHATLDDATNGLGLARPQLSPAYFSFELRNRAARVEISYLVKKRDGKSDPGPLTMIPYGHLTHDQGLNLTNLPPEDPSNPQAHIVQWDFLKTFPDADQVSYELDLQIAIAGDPASELIEGANIGNDPPRIFVQPPPAGESRDTATIYFNVADWSEDQVLVEVEYSVDGGPFLPATGEYPTVTGQANTARKGQAATFEWDVAEDLEGTSGTAMMKLKPSDLMADGAKLTTGKTRKSDPFSVDANFEPVAFLDEFAFLLNPDQRRGLPIPFQMQDQEGDAVTVVFQWSDSASFDSASYDASLDLPSNLDDLMSILDDEDPTRRKQLQILTELPQSVSGRIIPVSATKARLPELASTAAEATRNIVGQELEILRETRVLTPLKLPDLSFPVAAIPVSDGDSALVLDNAGGVSRLQELELASGDALQGRVLAGTGSPTAMAFDESRDEVLVASVVGSPITGPWSVHRVTSVSDLSKANVTLEATHPGSPIDGGAIRDIEDLGDLAAIATVGDMLIRLDFATGTASRLLDLNRPWGIVRDPGLQSSLVYVAERGLAGDLKDGRVLAIDLNDLNVSPVVEHPDRRARRGFLDPRSVALEQNGKRLLVVTDAGEDGQLELRAINLGGGVDLDGDRVTDTPDREWFEIAAGLGGGQIGELSTGPDHLRILPLASAGDLAVSGGLEQIRQISSYSDTDLTVTVSEAFAPPLTPGRTWRMQSTLGVLDTTAAGDDHVFLWDSSDVDRVGKVFLRLTAYDEEPGLTSQTVVGKTIQSPLDVIPGVFKDDTWSVSRPDAVASGDLDEDGDLDFVTSNRRGGASLFYQTSPGQFSTVSIPVDNTAMQRPRWVKIADVDGVDGPDVLIAAEDSRTVAIYFQLPSSNALYQSFNLKPVVLTTPGILGKSRVGPASVDVADFNGDGRMDIVTANAGGRDLYIFHQPASGFGSSQYTLPPDVVLSNPASPLYSPRVIAADINGDGLMDLASATSGYDIIDDVQKDGDIQVFLQKAGGFPSVVSSSDYRLVGTSNSGLWPTTLPFRIGAADLDRNGLMDLYAASQNTNEVEVFLQTSQGVFGDADGEPIVLDSVSDCPADIGTADLDGNGLLDLVAGPFVSNNLVVYHQDSPGVFEDAQILSDLQMNQPIGLDLADFNGDGRVDIVACNQGNASTANVFLTNGPGSFRVTPDAVKDPFMDDPIRVHAADLNGDRLAELICANETSGIVQVYFQVRPRIFNQAPLELVPAGPDALDVASGDLNGDGLVDLVVASSDELEVFFQGPGPGTGFGVTSDVKLPNGDLKRPNSLHVVDLNNDGLLDIVTTNTSNTEDYPPPPITQQKIVAYLQTDGTWNAPTVKLIDDPGLMDTTDLAVGDLDGDGILDLVAASRGARPRFRDNTPTPPPGSSSLVIFYLKSDQSVRKRVRLIDGDLVSPEAVIIADLDGDGRPDVASANSLRANVTAFLDRGSDFAKWDSVVVSVDSSLPISLAPMTLAAGDIDLDGDLDLVVGGPDLLVYPQQAPGVFLPFPTQLSAFPLTVNPRDVLLQDLDRDGELDIISANEGGDSLTVFYGSD